MKPTHLFLIFILLIHMACHNDQSIDLTIMTYNIKHGEGMDNVLDLKRSATVIRNQSPDLCGLQEIDHYCTRTDSVDQTGYLAGETNMTGTFGKFMDYQGGQYGMATLSKLPLLSTTILKLPDGIAEPRSSIVHEVIIADRCTIAFANVHLDWIGSEAGSKSRLDQARTLSSFLDSLNLPTIITGDFNCTPDSPTMNYFADQGYEFVEKGPDNLTFQGNQKSEIDHLIYRKSENAKFEVSSVRLLNEPDISDHRPLVIGLKVIY